MNQPVLNRYERKVSDLKKVPLGLKSLIAGSSRVVRMSSVQKDRHLQCIWNTAADVAAPTFLFFTWWILEGAKKYGIKRLYFLSRDGQILQMVAKILSDRFGYGIECQYLYVSRRACYLPALDKMGGFEIEWIMATDSDRSLSVNKVCERLNVDPDDIVNILIKHGLGRDGWRQNLSSRARNRLKECLQDEGLQKIVIAKAADDYKSAAGYLLQEGVGKPGGTCIVDMGWHGRIQYAMSKILDRADKRPLQGLHGFYLGIVDYEKSYKNDTVVSFLPLKWPMVLKDYMTINYTLYEIFAAADHGMVIGYSEKGGTFYPILSRQNNDKAISWGVKTQQESVVRFAEIFTKHYGNDIPRIKDIHSILEVLLGEFVQNPSPEEATAYGSYIHDAAITENALREVAPTIGYGDIFSSAARCDKTPKGTFWLTGSFVRSHMPFMNKIWYVFRHIFYLLKIVMPV